MPPKPPLTHFLALPLTPAPPALAASLAHFASALLQHDLLPSPDTTTTDRPVAGSWGRALRPPSTLHLTLAVMSLADPARLDAAASLLRRLDLAALLGRVTATESAPNLDDYVDAAGSAGRSAPAPPAAPPPVKVTLKGLASMRAPARTTNLVVLPEDPEGRLQRFAQALRDIFAGEGLVVCEPGRERVRLHVTVFNSVYARGGGRDGGGRGGREERVEGEGKGEGRKGGKKRSKAPVRIDATGLIEAFDGFVWGEDVELGRVAICKMGAVTAGEGDERYEEVCACGLR